MNDRHRRIAKLKSRKSKSFYELNKETIEVIKRLNKAMDVIKANNKIAWDATHAN